MKCPDMPNERECMGSLCSLYNSNIPCLKPHKITFIENDEGYGMLVEEVGENNEMPIQTYN